MKELPRICTVDASFVNLDFGSVFDLLDILDVAENVTEAVLADKVAL